MRALYRVVVPSVATVVALALGAAAQATAGPRSHGDVICDGGPSQAPTPPPTPTPFPTPPLPTPTPSPTPSPAPTFDAGR